VKEPVPAILPIAVGPAPDAGPKLGIGGIVAGAVVLHRPSGIKTETGADGGFVLDLPDADRYELEVIHPDFYERAFLVAREAMRSLPIVESPLRRAVVDHAIDLYRSARRAGLTVRSGVDCVIAACAIRNGLAVLHHDRDFDALAAVSPLVSRRVPG